MLTMRLRFVPLLLLICMLAAIPLGFGDDTTAQGSVPAGQFTPAFPDGPPIRVQPVNTVPPETPAGVPTAVPNPNQPPATTPPNPNQPPPPAPDEPPVPTATLVPIFPVEDPDESPPPETVEIDPGIDLPPKFTPVVIITPSSETPPVLRSATITIRTRVCDNEGFDPYSSFDLAALTAECPLSMEIFGFSMSRPGLAYSKKSFGGVVTFSAPPMTTVKIGSATWDGYDESTYVCQSAGAYDVWGDRELTWDTLAGEKVECTWFFVQNNDDINLELSKLTCPWFAPESLSAENVFCDGTSLGTFGEVRLSDTDPTTADMVHPAGSGGVTFIDLRPGTYTVTETGVGVGVAWTYWGHCFTVDPADGSPDPTFPLVKSTSFTITLSQVGDTVRCSSTNVLEESSTAEPSVPMATIKVRTAVCDNQGWDPYIRRPDSLAAYQAECTSPDPGFTFTVSQIGGADQTKSTASGEISFTVAGTGDSTLLLQTPASGYSLPVVSCENSLSPTVDSSPFPADQSHFFPEAGAVYTCTFFNVLKTTDVNLVVLGFTCPAAYDIDNPLAWGGMANPGDACGSSPGLHGTITLSDSDPATADQSLSSDGPPPVFLDLAPGTYSLTLTPKSEIASSFLYRCHAFPPDSGLTTWLKPISKGPTVSLPLTQAGKTVFCEWYVVPKPVTSSGGVLFPLPLFGAVADRRPS